jgi:hypothetical protein
MIAGLLYTATYNYSPEPEALQAWGFGIRNPEKWKS